MIAAAVACLLPLPLFRDRQEQRVYASPYAVYLIPGAQEHAAFAGHRQVVASYAAPGRGFVIVILTVGAILKRKNPA
jgi:hypothetical protein